MKYKVAVVGLVHDHMWAELPHWAALDKVELIAAADPNEPLRTRVANEFNIFALFEDYRELFDKWHPDIIQIGTSNAAAVEVVEAAAARGIHAVVEKPMAANLAGADRMLEAVQRSKTHLMINWPNWWQPNLVEAVRRIQAGELGKLYFARMRMAHRGVRELGCSPYFCEWLLDVKENGGGALLDFCSYGVVTFLYLLGQPESIQVAKGKFVKKDVTAEDNGLVTLLYDNAMALAEGSWSQIPTAREAQFLGTQGSLTLDRHRLWLTTEEGKPEEIALSPLPQGRSNGPDYFIHCLGNEKPIEGVFSPQLARDAQAILEC